MNFGSSLAYALGVERYRREKSAVIKRRLLSPNGRDFLTVLRDQPILLGQGSDREEADLLLELLGPPELEG